MLFKNQIDLIKISLLLLIITSMLIRPTYADKLPERLEQEQFFRATEAITGIPWYVIAAFYQYDKNIQKIAEGELPIAIHKQIWGGIGNYQTGERSGFLNGQFGGIGQDGNGDGIADKDNFYDAVYSLALWLSDKGTVPSEYMESASSLYNNETAMIRIKQIAAIYRHFGTVEVVGNSFPIPLQHHYSYRNSWGAGRSYGGTRSHEGTDIFAPAWTPVQSTTSGIVEIKGWNRYGGWRIGIRDVYNVYHYYAHLGGYAKELKEGDIVQAGQVIGYVGSSGYGSEGTTGKFPPHLHYGMYKDTGKNEWAFDPTPSLARWERADKQKKR